MRVSRIGSPNTTPIPKNVVSAQNAAHSAIETGLRSNTRLERPILFNRREAKTGFGNDVPLYSTVTLFARLRGLSTSNPFAQLM